MRFACAAMAIVGLLAASCGDDTPGGCTELREPVDPLSVQHVIDPETATFQTDPPTSGPHLSGPAVRGVQATPISPAAQVRVLEDGGVVVQYMDPVTEADLGALIDIVDGPIAVAPASDLPANVVVTAWTWKLTCDSVNLATIREFSATRPTNAPGAD